MVHIDSLGIVRPFEFGGVTRLIRCGKINWKPGKFLKIFNDTISLEAHKITYSSLRITGMALSIIKNDFT